jgi:hypothetical protein
MNIGISNYFLKRPLTAQEIRARSGKWDCIQLKSCTSKEAITRIKRQATEWEKMFSGY